MFQNVSTVYIRNMMSGTQNGGRNENMAALTTPKVKSSVTNMVPTADARKRPYMLCTVFTGGLGNNMFQLASLYAFAVRKGMVVNFSGEKNLNEFFYFDEPIYMNHSDCQNWTVRVEKHACSYDASLGQFKPTSDFKIFTYLQSWKYFESVKDRIKNVFRFRDPVASLASEVMVNLREKYEQNGWRHLTFVGVHIRRGDILTYEGFRNYGYTTATAQYIVDAMDVFVSNFSNVVFIVCSNDMVWSKNITMKSNYNVEFMEGNTAKVDMAILSSCDHVIMTVGTFGWWAAYLAGGKTIYYKYPAREGSDLRKEFSQDYSDYFYPGWIGKS